MNELCKNNEYLTDNEVLLVINSIKIIGSMDYGINKLVYLGVIITFLKIVKNS